MRIRIRIVLAVLAAVFIAAHLLLWVAMSSKGPQILQESLSRYFGYSVQADRVKVSLLSQRVKIKNLAVSDPAHPEAPPFLTAKTVYLRLNLFALFARRISIQRVLVYSPCLTVSRDPNGRWILPIRPAKPAQNDRGQEPGRQKQAPQSQVTRTPASSWFHFQINFHKLEIRKGEILFDDQTVSPPFWVRLKNIRVQGQFTSPTFLRFGLTGEVEERAATAFDISGECELRDGKFSSEIVAKLNDLDITLLTPYYQHHSPVGLASGKLDLRSTLRCRENVVKDSEQTITLKDLRFHSWSKEFLDGQIFGISNKELAEYLERNRDRIDVNFSISGPLDELKSLPTKDSWHMLGMSVVDQWFHKGKSQ